MTPLQFGDNKEWHHRTGPELWGFGLDTNYYSPPEKPAEEPTKQ